MCYPLKASLLPADSPINAKLDTAWTIVEQRYARLLPHDKLADLEHAAELHIAANPSLTADELAEWIVAPYDLPRPRKPSQPRKPRPLTGKTPLADADAATVWAFVQLRYTRPYMIELRMHFERAALAFMRENPARTISDLAAWLRERNHARKFPKP